MLALALVSLLATHATPRTSSQQWDGRYFLGGLTGSAGALATFDDESGPALDVGGRFTGVDDLSANQVVGWDGRGWSPLGSGPSGTSPNDVDVKTMLVHDDGSGPALFVGGKFTTATVVRSSNLACWADTPWRQRR